MKTIILITIALLIGTGLRAQFTQNLRGLVTDRASGITLPGASVSVKVDQGELGTITNEKGEFELIQLPIGRYNIQVSFIGYNAITVRNVELTSGKEKIVNVALTEKIEELQEVVVSAFKNGETRNKMAVLSARSFSVNQTEKYAGSWGDPSRMASNFAGVITANDSRNDIVIRGNSPQGLLWKLEGISIPNPNHFGALGSTGGPVSILNNNVLTNSDFFTGAFPSEYGNSLSGVFDLKMRNGNNKKHEFVGQIGFNGFEVGAEGPLSIKNRSSYMVNYRYSVLSVMDKIGFNSLGSGVPEYQDLTFRFNLPTHKAGTFALFGIGGDSFIEFNEDDSESATYDVVNNQRTQNGSKLGIMGLTHRIFPDSKSNIYTTVSATYQTVSTKIDSLFDDLNPKIFFGEKNSETRLAFSSKYTRKINAKNTIKTGIEFQSFAINYKDSITGEVFNPPLADTYILELNTQEKGLNLFEGFAEWQHRLNTNLTLYGGIHYLRYFNNKAHALDPRTSVSYTLPNSGKVSLAYGKHSQSQPQYVYFTESYNFDTGKYSNTNSDLDFTKAHHFVGGYDQMLGANLKLKLETYYQHLYDIPITNKVGYFSMVNAGNSFNQEKIDYLVNGGLGRNYGAEITLEKYLSNNYYFLFTSSLFDSKYKASDEIWRNTEFNTNYVVNALAGYEIQLGAKSSFDMNVRMIASGGKRNLFIDLEKSIQASETVYDYSKAYSEKGEPYFRVDARIAFKMNGKRMTQEWALDVTNVSNHKNVYSTRYDDPSQSIKLIYQQGFYPMFLYRITF